MIVRSWRLVSRCTEWQIITHQINISAWKLFETDMVCRILISAHVQLECTIVYDWGERTLWLGNISCGIINEYQLDCMPSKNALRTAHLLSKDTQDYLNKVYNQPKDF